MTHEHNYPKDEGLTILLLLRRIYDLERELPNRNFAKGHSFSEWRDRFSLCAKKSFGRMSLTV